MSAIILTVVGGYVAASGASADSDASGATAAGVLTATQTVTVTATVTTTATVTVPGPTRTVTAAPTQSGSTASATSQTGPAAPTVRSSTLFGAYPGFSLPTDQSEPLASRLARVSDEFGGKLGVTRIFRGGRLTLPPMTGPSIVSWNFPVAATLAGQYDAQIDAIARGATQPLWFVPWHEVDNHKLAPSDYVALFRYIAERVHAIDNPLVKMTPIMMGFTVRNLNLAAFNQYYPGDAYADAIGFDTYINPGVPVLSTPEGVEAAPIAIAALHHKPLVIGEVSLYPGYSEAQRTDFVRRLITLLDTPSTDAVAWFETNKADGDWRMVGDSSAVAEWAAVSSR